MKFFSKIDLMPQINKKLSSALMTYDFIGDIPLDRDDFLHLKTYVKLMYLNLNGKKMILNKYREAFSVFLCFCAVYEFNPAVDYWSCVEKNIGAMDDDSRAAIDKVFEYIVDKYNLNKNFNKNSINLLTENILSSRIIFYSGIPTACLDNLFNILYPTVEDTAYFELSVEELLLYLKNRAADNIILQYLNNIPKDRAYNFIQIIRRRLGDNLAEVDDTTDFDNGNFIRMQSALDEWNNQAIKTPIDNLFEDSWNIQPYIA
ncbi:MAG: hypothetical protein IJ797_09340, partial [Selenomonadaceae bacterium]|nr:hypothetical protein [Selenomonadaceae bacterium]